MGPQVQDHREVQAGLHAARPHEDLQQQPLEAALRLELLLVVHLAHLALVVPLAALFRGDHQEDLRAHHQEGHRGDHQEDLRAHHQEDHREDHREGHLEDHRGDHQEDLRAHHQEDLHEDRREGHQEDHRGDHQEDRQEDHQEDLREGHQGDHQEDLREGHQEDHRGDHHADHQELLAPVLLEARGLCSWWRRPAHPSPRSSGA